MRAVIDLVLLAIIIISIWSGYKKGLIMGIAALCAAIISLYGASLVSEAYSYEVVPVLRPFVSGYIQNRMENEVLEDLGIDNTSLSVEDVLSGDPSLPASTPSAYIPMRPTRWPPRRRNMPRPMMPQYRSRSLRCSASAPPMSPAWR